MQQKNVSTAMLNISIHAPRTGSDLIFLRLRTVNNHFNPRSPHGERRQGLAGGRVLHAISIHAPRTGSDKSRRVQSVLTKRFQSTLPARGATEAKQRRYNGENHFNPRSPHGERQQVHPAVHKGCCISIHAPRTGSDGKSPAPMSFRAFQSTLPARGATALDSVT